MIYYDLFEQRLPDKLLSARVYPDSQSQRPGVEPPGGQGLMFPLPGCSIGRQDNPKSWTSGTGGGGMSGPRGFGGAGGEVDEETKKNQNIINIVREGQISLLVSGRSTHADRV